MVSYISPSDRELLCLKLLTEGECLNLIITKISYYFIFRHRLKLSLTFFSSYMYHKSDFANILFSVIVYPFKNDCVTPNMHTFIYGFRFFTSVHM